MYQSKVTVVYSMCSVVQVGERIRVILDCEDNTLAFEKNYEFLGKLFYFISLRVFWVYLDSHLSGCYTVICKVMLDYGNWNAQKASMSTGCAHGGQKRYVQTNKTHLGFSVLCSVYCLE